MLFLPGGDCKTPSIHTPTVLFTLMEKQQCYGVSTHFPCITTKTICCMLEYVIVHSSVLQKIKSKGKQNIYYLNRMRSLVF